MLRVSPVHLLPVCDADKQRADDTLSNSGQDGLPQSGKVPESLSYDKREQRRHEVKLLSLAAFCEKRCGIILCGLKMPSLSRMYTRYQLMC